MIPSTKQFVQFIFMTLVVLFVSCSGSIPQINAVHYQLNLVYDADKNISYESLSVFTAAVDDDGVDDIARLYIMIDDKRLYWEIGEKYLQKIQLENEDWFGSQHIVMPDRSIFPRGLYRIQLADKGGHRSESDFLLPYNRSLLQETAFPQVSITEDSLTVSGSQAAYKVWFYTNQGELQHVQEMNAGTHKIRDLYPASVLDKSIEYIKIYTVKQDQDVGVITGPYYILK